MNVLVVTAHHDDLELGCGGTVAKLVERGHKVISLVMTHSGYKDPEGRVVRTKEASEKEARIASCCLGYKLISFKEDTFDMQVNDSNICKIKEIIGKHKIDTIFTHWHGDTHIPHQRLNSMVLHAGRHTPRLFGFYVNWYVGRDPFYPQLFVFLNESQWERKIRALKCYKSEFQRAGEKWVEYMDNQAKSFGLQFGVKRAEGFIVYKDLWEF